MNQQLLELLAIGDLLLNLQQNHIVLLLICLATEIFLVFFLLPLDLQLQLTVFVVLHFLTSFGVSVVGSYVIDRSTGKLLGVPVYQILGGKTRDRVRVAAVLSMKGTVESLLESADEFFEQGFRHLVLKIGVDPREDLRNAEALRKRFGDDIALRPQPIAVW